MTLELPVDVSVLVPAKDEAEAVELAKGCPVLRGSGSVEVRPVMKFQP